MIGWRSRILLDFEPDASKLTIAEDPDHLILDEAVVTELEQRRFHLLPYQDLLEFRIAYESEYRLAWERGEGENLVVVMTDGKGLEDVPYDLFSACRISHRLLSYKIADLFPNLSPSVTREIDKNDLDDLAVVCESLPPGVLFGDNETCSFLLKNLYGYDSSTENSPSGVLQWLFTFYFGARATRPVFLPSKLSAYIVERLSSDAAFQGWPLADLLATKSRFVSFLQAQWEAFLKDSPGSLVPFADYDISVHLENLFREDVLKPVQCSRLEGKPSWVTIGVLNEGNSPSILLTNLIKKMKENHPTPISTVSEWLEFAREWGEFRFMRYLSPDSYDGTSDDFLNEIEGIFENWICQKFSTVYNLPYLPLPKVVSQVGRYLVSVKENSAKVALVVIDGMSLSDWQAIKNEMLKIDERLSFDENTILAWVPTITAFSRKAIFAGSAPVNFFSARNCLDEETLWKGFWQRESREANEAAIAYASTQGDQMETDLLEALQDPKVKVLGVVISKVDRIMHGAEVGTKGMLSNVKMWAAGSGLNHILSSLLGQGFRVFITSDHGNTEAVGVGEPHQGILPDEKGKRARVYSGKGAEDFRDAAYATFPDSIPWPSGAGLSSDVFVLMPKHGLAYTTKGKQVVTHGGLTIEEALIPFVEVRRVGQ